MKDRTAIFIFPIAIFSLVLGIIAGLQRISWDIPLANLSGQHGAIMTGSLIGTLICLERCIVNPRKWWRLLPIINGLSIVLFLIHEPKPAYILLIAGSAGLLVLMITYFKRTPNLSHALLALGALAWLTGNLVLFNQHSYPAAVKWWMLFLLWTIFGERLELSSMLPVSSFKRVTLYLVLVINLTGVFFPFHWFGNEIFAVSLMGMACWLFAYDMTRYAFRQPGQHRYIALWLMSGYGWLIVTALWLLCWPDAPYAYDAALHSFFLGFVFSMIFGHVPIIFPGVFRINISLYHPGLYIVFVIFQISLLTRIGGDALLDTGMRKWGALINGSSMLLFFIANGVIIKSRLNQKNYVSAER